MPNFSPGARAKDKYYDLLFAAYDRLLYKRLGKFYDALFRLDSRYVAGHQRVLDGLTSGSILDVACGTGTLLAIAGQRGLRCYGVDLSQGMLERARAKAADADLRIGDFENLPYPGDCFDCVVATNAIGSVKVNPSSVLSEMMRVCKPGGEVRLADYAEPLKKSLCSRLVIALFKLLGDTPYDYRHILEGLGYTPDIEVLGYFSTYQYIRVQKRLS